MTSHFILLALLAMLTKWTRQPWTSSFNHHTLALQSTFESPYSGIHNIDSIDLLCQFQNTVSGIYSKHSVPGGRMLRMKCNDSMIIFLVSQLVHNSKEKGELHWWQWNKKIQCSYQCLDREDRQALVWHMNFPAPFWSNSWSWRWENSLKCDKISLSKLNKIAVWGKI